MEETLSGRSDTLKGYTIAVRVFGRAEESDLNQDPIVRIQAGKLRRDLERYYLVTEPREGVQIEIPKGTYVPTFRERTSGGSYQVPSAEQRSEQSWPTILVRPFQNLTGDAENQHLGLGLASDLAVEIARFQDVRVALSALDRDHTGAAESAARFVIDGNIRLDGTEIKVNVHLTDATTNRQIWGETHRSELAAAPLFAFQETVARTVAAQAAASRGVIARTLSAESRTKPPSQLKTYEAILRFHEFYLTLTPASFLRAMSALQHAVQIEPDCGPAWSALAQLYGNICSLEIPGLVDPVERALEMALECAETGARLDQGNQRSRATLALIRFYDDQLPAALAEVEAALALNPNSLYIIDGIGYLLTLLGQWERGRALIERAIRENPNYILVVHYALWVDCIRQQEYQQAYLETRNFKRPAVFWDPLGKAATCGLLGSLEEGRRAAQTLLELKPDFPARGRVLIKRYIKFDDIVERVIDGLRKVGVEVQ